MEKIHTVLIVDDDPAWRETLELTLRTNSVSHVMSCSNGEEAIDLLSETNGNIDAIVTDTAMPIKSGVELLLHTRVKFPKIPVIILFCFLEGSNLTADDLYILGAHKVLTKMEATTDLLPTLAAMDLENQMPPLS